jgi:hypothetical protein
MTRGRYRQQTRYEEDFRGLHVANRSRKINTRVPTQSRTMTNIFR